MQYHAYRNRNNSKQFPYLIDVQTDLIDALGSRVVIPVCRLDDYKGRRVDRLMPLIEIDGDHYILLTYDLAGVSISVIGEKVCSVEHQRSVIKASIDLVFDGF